MSNDPDDLVEHLQIVEIGVEPQWRSYGDHLQLCVLATVNLHLTIVECDDGWSGTVSCVPNSALPIARNRFGSLLKAHIDQHVADRDAKVAAALTTVIDVFCAAGAKGVADLLLGGTLSYAMLAFVADAAGAVAHPDVVAALKTLFSCSESRRVRVGALRGLARREPTDDREIFSRALQDRDVSVRLAARLALEKRQA